MSKIYLFIFLIFSPFFCLSQQLSFEASEALFDHPKSDAGLGYPYIPFDYNSDGFTDFIGATFNEQYLYKGIANDQFEQIDIYQGFSHSPLKVMDFDMDGDMDVIMERYINLYESADSFTFFNPDINFQEDIVEVADFDNNGINDLLTHKSITFANDELIIHYGQVGGGFVSEVIYSEYDYGDIEVADIDGNGDLDILVLLEFATPQAVILFNSSTTFTPSLVPTFFSFTRTTIKLADFDGDLDLDMITLGSFDDVYILENIDNFQTTNSFKIISLIDADYFSLDDLDLDGDIDIVVAANNSSNSTLSLYSIENKGGLNFDTAVEIEMFGGANSLFYQNFNYVANNLSLYDFDGDGKKDIIYVDGYDSNQVLYLKNTSTTTSIKNLTEQDAISVFPNPVDDQLKIEMDNFNDFSKYEIFSISGKRMATGILNGEFINVSNLNAGIYLLKIDGLHSIRFVKK